MKRLWEYYLGSKKNLLIKIKFNKESELSFVSGWKVHVEEQESTVRSETKFR